MCARGSELATVPAVAIRAYPTTLSLPADSVCFMEERYSYAKEGPAPCNICGKNVREQLLPGDARVGGVSGPPEVKRICTNPRCPSNTGRDLRHSQAV